MIRMTVEQIRASQADFLKAEDVAKCMKMKPDRFRKYARENKFPFPVRVSGNRVTVSRTGFLKYLDGDKEQYHHEEQLETLMGDLVKEVRAMTAALMAIMIHYCPDTAEAIIQRSEEVAQ